MSFPRLARAGLASGLVLALAGPVAAQRTLPSTLAPSSPPSTIRPAKPVSLDFGPSTFRRIATFEVFENTDVGERAVAEIVASAEDGHLLVYTDSEQELVGFVDITDPTAPAADGTIDVGGEPTSVAIAKQIGLFGATEYALVCVNTSASFTDPSGKLVVIDIATRSIVRELDLGGQPDAIAVAPTLPFACVCIENERDEDLANGEPPQAPAGFLVIVDLFGPPPIWTTRAVGLNGVCDLFPNDPEPEFVDINGFGTAVVTCQENNHIVLVDLVTGTILDDFSAGTFDLDEVDTNENDLIEQTASIARIPREPDAVAWISQIAFATADEGDLFGGSRTFTNWSAIGGHPTFSPGPFLEHFAARLGHYPENRSENKGVEPEGAEFGWFGARRFLFVGAERANLVFVYEIVAGPVLGQFIPIFRQALPTGVGPEGLLAIGERDLFVVACEEDDRDDGIRSTIMIYERSDDPVYPTLYSEDREGTDVPIPWGGISGIALGSDRETAWAVHDDVYERSRIYAIDRSTTPARITDELVLTDPRGQLWVQLFLTNLIWGGPGTDFDIDDIINADDTVNLDIEGIHVDENGDFWLCTEGAGEIINGASSVDEPFVRPNLIVHANHDGEIRQVYRLPFSVDDDQERYGFSGIAKVGNHVYVSFQRPWQVLGDPSNVVRIGRIDITTNAWQFAYFPLPAVTSPNGGVVGVNDIDHVGGGEFVALVCDDQTGSDATIKRIQSFDVDGVTWFGELAVPAFDTLAVTDEVDLLLSGAFDPFAGIVPAKLDGLARLESGDFVVVNDNDGVDDSNGETLIVEVGPGIQ